MTKKTSTFLSLLVLAIFLVSLQILYRELRAYSLREIVGSLLLISPGKLALAALATALNYLVVCGYDVLAFSYLRLRLPCATILYTAFIGDAVSNVAGYSMLSSGTVKYRLYSRQGVPLAQVAEVVLFSSIMLWTGLFMVGGLMFAVQPSVVAWATRFSEPVVRAAGILFTALVAGYVALSACGVQAVGAGKWKLRLPSPGVALGQVLLSSADWLFSALVLYTLLPRSPVSFFSFLAVYLPAQLLAILSQVPGGLGVFETVVLLLFPRICERADVIAALLSFRIIYYFLPFSLAVVLFIAGRAGKKMEGGKP